MDKRKLKLVRELREVFWMSWLLEPDDSWRKELCPYFRDMVGCWDCLLKARSSHPSRNNRQECTPTPKKEEAPVDTGAVGDYIKLFDQFLSFYDIPEEELAYAALPPEED